MNNEMMENNSQAQGYRPQRWSYWKKWRTEIDENSPVSGAQFLKELCEAYQSRLSKAREKYDKDKDEIREKNQQVKKAIDNRKSLTVAGIERAANESSIKADNIENEVKGYRQDLSDYLIQTNPEGSWQRRVEKLFSSSTSGMENIANAAILSSDSMRAQVDSAIGAYRKQIKLLKDERCKQAYAAAELEHAREFARFSEEEERLKSNYDGTISNIQQQFASSLNEVMSKEDIDSYIKTVLSTIPSFENFACSNVIPEHICLGNVTMEIARKASIYPEITQMLEREAGKALDAATPGTITVSLPYCQRLDSGISMFLNHSSSERVIYREYLKMLLLKLFMAFPAGKLEATMIDPLELGESFSLFTKLGEEEARIIDRKAWSQEKDISEAIHTLRQKLETMTQSYGDDKAARLKKEPVRVLAITDFPTGFTQNALHDLQAIVRKSASYGICVFIWANREEVAKLQTSQQPILNEIRETLHVASSVGNGVLKLETAKYDNVYLHLEPISKVQEHTHSIISTLAKGIHDAPKPPERFVDMFEKDMTNSTNWFQESTIDELAIPIGINGKDTVVKITMGKTSGSIAHHALIAAQTGAGKSTLLHTIIMSVLLNYYPDEAQLYLIDFKEGVEFKTYSKMNNPSIRVVAIDCEREFALNILRELQAEMKRRFAMFEREEGCTEISAYRKANSKSAAEKKIPVKKVPKLLLVIDEVQDLFRIGLDDEINRESALIMTDLLEKGRAAGIHIILTSQTFEQVSNRSALYPHAAIRIAIKGSEDSAHSVLGSGNSGIKQLREGAAGAAIFNEESGNEAANVVFRVGYMENKERNDFLQKLNGIQNEESFAKIYQNKTRVLLTAAEDDVFNPFNQLIHYKKVSTLDDDDTRYCLMIGNGFSLNRKFKIGIAPKRRQNLLIVGNEKKRAESIFCFSMLSLLYGELGNKNVRKDNQLIRLIDLSTEDEETMTGDTDFKQIKALFDKQVERVGKDGMDSMISATYDNLQKRISGEESTNERLFLMFFGIDRAHSLKPKNMYEEENHDKMSTLSKLTEIMKYGAEFGINCIVWGGHLGQTTEYMGVSIDRDFAQRIVFSTDNEAMEKLVMEYNGAALRASTAVYMNVDDDIKNTHFRPYEIPAGDWVKKLAGVYHEFEQGGGA